MHMADALLSPTVGIGFYAVSGVALSISCRRVVKERDYERKIPLMGVMGAFVFAAQMINFAIPGTGSSGHIGGGLLLASLIGPYAAFIVISAILTVQCLFFADGGLLALGCNIFNLGFWPVIIGYPLFKLIAGNSSNMKRVLFASIMAVIISLEAGAFSVACQTVLSGRSELPFARFAAVMLLIHLPIAIAEGIITAFVYSYVRKIMPDRVDAFSSDLHWRRRFARGLVLVSLAVILVGAFLSWFASSSPDGLEWSIGKITGTDELDGTQGRISSVLQSVQSKTAILPDYAFPEANAGGRLEEKTPWPDIEAGTSLAGLTGIFITAALILIAAFALNIVSKKLTAGGKCELRNSKEA